MSHCTHPPDSTRRRRPGLGRRTGRASPPPPAPPAAPGSLGQQRRQRGPGDAGGIKAKAATDITERVNDLNAAIGKVNAAKGLGSGQATLCRTWAPTSHRCSS